MKLAAAVRAIERAGILLVFPINNEPEPRSLWSALHPRRRMRWAWDDSGDNEVAELWHLRERLARSGKVVYVKWYRGRATMFSESVFVAMLAELRATGDLLRNVSAPAREILGLLEENSPVSTKELRRQAIDLGHVRRRPDVDRALNELWPRLLLVGVGEVEDGAFPSLSLGAASLLREALWSRGEHQTAEGRALLGDTLARAPLFSRYFEGVRKKIAAGGPSPPERSAP